MSNINEVGSLVDECHRLVSNIEKLDNSTIYELFELQKILIKFVNDNLDVCGTDMRVLLCEQQDVVLSKIVEFHEQYENNHINNVYTPAIQGLRYWKNVELLKDKGLVGYYLGKQMNAKPNMMFCSKNEEYTFSELLLNQELIYFEEDMDQGEQYTEFLLDNYKEMDLLVLHGIYSETMAYLAVYRKLRPDGKVFCGLDMNSGWANSINWSAKEVVKFATQCDVIATSSTYVRDLLNAREDVTFPCYYIPNGFFNINKYNIVADSKKKENIILTVGRIGTEQKNTEYILKAFAKTAHLLPDWSLRLVGTIEPAFKEKIKIYFEENPHLRNRVIFTGPIYDKQELYNEYVVAKCFVLTSTFEGSPNVFAEALVHGCKFIVSNVDVAEEMTNFGELGEVYPYNDLDALIDCMLRLKNNSSEKDFEEHIPKALKYAHEVFDWDKISKKLAFMLNNL